MNGPVEREGFQYKSHQIKCPGPDARSLDARTVDAIIVVNQSSGYMAVRCPLYIERGGACKLASKLSCIYTGWGNR